MGNKRENLRKLKESRMQQSIEEISSPVEDKLKALEEQEEKTETLEVVAAEKEEVTEEIKREEIREEKKEEEGQEAKEETKDIKSVTTENKQEDEEKAIEAGEVVTEPEIAVQTAQETIKEAEPEAKSVAVAAKEKTKRTSMALLVENNKFLRLRAMQLGYSIQNYVNLLIEEEIERSKAGNPVDLAEITDNLDMNYRRGQNSTIVALVLKESNARFLKRGGAMFGMNATTFLNHIISEEQKREKENGPRKGEFDEL